MKQDCPCCLEVRPASLHNRFCLLFSHTLKIDLPHSLMLSDGSAGSIHIDAILHSAAVRPQRARSLLPAVRKVAAVDALSPLQKDRYVRTRSPTPCCCFGGTHCRVNRPPHMRQIMSLHIDNEIARCAALSLHAPAARRCVTRDLLSPGRPFPLIFRPCFPVACLCDATTAPPSLKCAWLPCSSFLFG